MSKKHFLTRTGEGIKAKCLIKFVRCQHKVSFRLPTSADLHLNRAVVKAAHVSHWINFASGWTPHPTVCRLLHLMSSYSMLRICTEMYQVTWLQRLRDRLFFWQTIFFVLFWVLFVIVDFNLSTHSWWYLQNYSQKLNFKYNPS